jgi:predicted CXXCH cytochrome family protein
MRQKNYNAVLNTGNGLQEVVTSMRHYKVLLLIAMLLVAVAANAQYSRIADITGTNHNLSSTSTGTVKAQTFTQICFFCHVPHQMQETNDPAVTTAPNAQYPLWNHYLSSKSSYGVYSSPSFDAFGTDIADLGGAVAGSATVSNLCLSCHDGTVGVNTLYKGQRTGTAPTLRDSPAMNCNGTLTAVNVPCLMPADAQIGSDTLGLRDEHPLNFTYDAALAAKSVSLVVPVTNTTLGGSRLGVPTSSGKFLPLFASKMQCATCHDVHSNAAGRPFLRASTTGSEICLACHGK